MAQVATENESHLRGDTNDGKLIWSIETRTLDGYTYDEFCYNGD